MTPPQIISTLGAITGTVTAAALLWHLAMMPKVPESNRLSRHAAHIQGLRSAAKRRSWILAAMTAVSFGAVAVVHFAG